MVHVLHGRFEAIQGTDETGDVSADRKRWRSL